MCSVGHCGVDFHAPVDGPWMHDEGFFIGVQDEFPAAAALVDGQVVHREMVLDGLLGIANGENPRLIEARLAGFLPSKSEP